MAEPNYVEEINRQRQQARQRTRSSQIIDPLESQAQMDRMQGASVSSGSRSFPMDSGSSPIIATAGSGRGSIPVRTAGFPIIRGGGTVVSSPMMTSGDCANGQCGTSQPMYSSPMPMGGTVVSGMPMGSTVVSGMPIESMPMGTVINETPAVPSTNDGTDQLTPIRQYAIDKAGPKYGGVTAAKVLSDAEKRQTWMMQADRIEKARKESNQFIKPMLDAKVAETQASAREKEANALATTAAANVAAETTGMEFNSRWSELLEQVAAGKISPLQATTAGSKILASRSAMDAKGNVSVNSEMAFAQKAEQLRRAASAASVTGIFYRSYEAWKGADTALDVMSGAPVSRDPATGKAVEVKDNSYKARASADNEFAINGLVATYDNMLGKPWPAIEEQLASDLLVPLQAASAKLYLTENADTLSSLDGDARQAAEKFLEDKAKISANATYDYVRSRLIKANVERGGGSPDNPQGGMWSQVRQALSPSPSAWGAAPPVAPQQGPSQSDLEGRAE